MAPRPRAHKGIRQPSPPPATPNVEEIAEELAEELDEDAPGDEQTMSQEAVEELGALNAEAVQANRQREDVVRKKRGGGKRVAWGHSNACLMYDSILKLYPASSLAMLVERLTGTPASWYLTSQPLNGQELYKSILQQCHGRAPETQYKVTVQDAASQVFRGVGRVMLPSTLNDPMLGAPQQQPYPPGVYPGQPAYGALPPAAPPPAPLMMPQQQQQLPPPTHPDFVQILALQKQLSEITHALQQLQGRGAPAVPAPAPAAAGPTVVAPGLQAPPGYALVLVNGQQVLVPISQLGLGGVPPAAAAPAQPPAPPPPPPPTPQQQFASAVGTLSDAVRAVENLRSTLLPQGAAAAPAAPAVDEKDPEYIKATKLGDMTIVQNRDDGSFLPIETVLANGDKIMSWVKEQRQLLAGQQQPTATNGAAQQASGGQMAPPTIPVQGP